jgi:hypothetical protein
MLEHTIAQLGPQTTELGLKHGHFIANRAAKF